MLPVGFNPHLLPETTQKTTRAALSDDLAIPTNYGEEFTAVVEILNKRTQSSLGTFEVGPSNARGRKLSVKPRDEERNMTRFRLVSSILPPQPISLLPSHTHSIPHQRPAEDTLHEARLREKRAHEIAVDADWVFLHAQVRKPPDTRSSSKIVTPSSSDVDVSRLPRLFITERVRPASSTSSRKEESKADAKCCPIVPVTDLGNLSKRKPKRKPKTKVRDRPPPTFFRPMQEWEGKSMGYAMGWGNSGLKAGPYRYRRDNMRRGITLAQSEKIG